MLCRQGFAKRCGWKPACTTMSRVGPEYTLLSSSMSPTMMSPSHGNTSPPPAPASAQVYSSRTCWDYIGRGYNSSVDSRGSCTNQPLKTALSSRQKTHIYVDKQHLSRGRGKGRERDREEGGVSKAIQKAMSWFKDSTSLLWDQSFFPFYQVKGLAAGNHHGWLISPSSSRVPKDQTSEWPHQLAKLQM